MKGKNALYTVAGACLGVLLAKTSAGELAWPFFIVPGAVALIAALVMDNNI